MNNEPDLPQWQPLAHQPIGTEQQLHHSYLLRLWCSSVDGAWRASLQAVQSGERHVFADIARLLAFLAEITQTGDRENSNE
ncbi:MAG: hypothetical protein R2867_11505 [Caldilineaceae bacterium]